jgi:hypothetical protein
MCVRVSRAWEAFATRTGQLPAQHTCLRRALACAGHMLFATRTASESERAHNKLLETTINDFLADGFNAHACIASVGNVRDEFSGGQRSSRNTRGELQDAHKRDNNRNKCCIGERFALCIVTNVRALAIRNCLCAAGDMPAQGSNLQGSALQASDRQ